MGISKNENIWIMGLGRGHSRSSSKLLLSGTRCRKKDCKGKRLQDRKSEISSGKWG